MSARDERAAKIKAAILELWSPDTTDEELRTALAARGFPLKLRTVQDYRRRYVGRRRAKRPELDVDRLREMCATGAPDAEVAAVLGCTMRQVQDTRLELGIKRRRDWTVAEERLIRAMWSKGSSDEEIAGELARRRPDQAKPSPDSVLRVRRKLGAIRKFCSVRDLADSTLRTELARRGDALDLGTVSTAKLVEALEVRGYSVRISKGPIKLAPHEDVGRRLMDMHTEAEA